MVRNDLVKVFNDTIKRCNETPLSRKTEYAKASSKVYFENFSADRRSYRSNPADVIVEENTSFATALKYKSFGKVAVLNFANPENPGGGVINGAMAQEECLCRCSNLYPCLAEQKIFNDYYGYHRRRRDEFYTDRLIYTKNITVFKDENYKILPEEKWFDLDIITCAAPYIGKRKYTNRVALLNTFKSRIRNIFEVAIANKVDVIILGAFGCGAFKNPPVIVASAFHEVIDENIFLSIFSGIVFAIKVDNEAENKNLCEFSDEFNDIQLTENCPEYHLPEIELPNGKIIPAVVIGDCKGPSGIRMDEVKVNFSNGAYSAALYESENNVMLQREFMKWQYHNPYFGKQFSILGDSISTLEGYNPKGYKVFYSGENCEKSGVNEIEDTWWGKVINYFGGELLVNNSWSGSRVTKLPGREQLFPSGCSDERTSSLHIGAVKPDVIIVHLGTNDWARGVKLRSETGNYGDIEENFEQAYSMMLDKVRRNYPVAEIWCCTLCETYIAEKTSFKFPHTYAGIHVEAYNEIVRDMARQKHCKLIDLYDYHMPYDSIDGSHPTRKGMSTIATAVVWAVSGTETDIFMDYKNNQQKVKRESFMRKKCKICGTEVAEEAKFCHKCGASEFDNSFWENTTVLNQPDSLPPHLPPQTSEKKKIGLIIGAAVGAFLLLIIIIAVIASGSNKKNVGQPMGSLTDDKQEISYKLTEGEAAGIAEERIKRFARLESIGIVCDYDPIEVPSDSDGYTMGGEKNAVCSCCKTPEEAKEHLHQYLDAKYDEMFSEIFLYPSPGELYLFSRNDGQTYYQKIKLQSWDNDKIIVAAEKWVEIEHMGNYLFTIEQRDGKYLITDCVEIEEPIQTPETPAQTPEAPAQTPETPTQTSQAPVQTPEDNNISEEQARKLAERIDGTYAEETNYQIGYTLETMVRDMTGLEYYLFRVRWLVEDHWSTIGGIAISVDGRQWKSVDIYQNYKDGDTIKEVFEEGMF